MIDEGTEKFIKFDELNKKLTIIEDALKNNDIDVNMMELNLLVPYIEDLAEIKL